MPTPRRIDAHHHLWRYGAEEYAWITGEMAVIRSDFLPGDLRAALRSANVDAAIAVQARQSLEETEWLLKCAHEAPEIAAVVGWLPLKADNLSELLDKVHTPRLAGLRHIVQAEPDGFLGNSEFNRGIAHLTARGLTYDVLIYERQLPEAIRFVDRHPLQQFVLDHAAKPRIAAGELEPWARNIRDLARRPNICCKLSGLVTEARWNAWNLDTLRPYLDTCVEAFGTDRLLAGSDWPVCLVASSYAGWWAVLEEYFAGFSTQEKEKVFGTNAVSFYHLSTTS
ncbi:MAG TPA: amidohydrolase family protein [Terracidiphilus sp.]|jgi:L-fuconolactonase